LKTAIEVSPIMTRIERERGDGSRDGSTLDASPKHCSEKHLRRYLSEFDFRYSNRSAVGVEDQERASRALLGITGKRLTYRGTDSVA
jgi:hypothetical protein